MNSSVLVLGSSGMIGSYVMRELGVNYSDVSVVGTSRSGEHGKAFDFQKDDIEALVTEARPDIVLNLLPGYSDELFAVNDRLLQSVRRVGARYIYMSSALVFDGDATRVHSEKDMPVSAGEYGSFKARCEQAISIALEDYAIVRISATHGFQADKPTRTERFLQRLQGGGDISVDSGVIQNRLWTGDLAEMLSIVCMSDVRGPVHLGTVDSSSEFAFLTELARAFGYDDSRIQEAPAKGRNLVVTPGKIFEIAAESVISESGTIQKVRDEEALVRYIKS